MGRTTLIICLIINRIILELLMIQSIEQSKVLENPKSLKKFLPKGTCIPHEYNKYQYVNTFLEDHLCHQYILPLHSSYAKFVIVKTILQCQKYPLYKLYHHTTHKLILSAQEKGMSIGCNYLISRSQKPKKDRNYVGKLRGNFSNNQFHIYDNGEALPKQKEKARKHLGLIKKEEKSLWSNSQTRKIFMITPQSKESYVQSNGIRKYEPIELYSCQESKNPLAENYQLGTGNVEYLGAKDNRIDTNGLDKKKILFVLQNSLEAEALKIEKKTQTFYEINLGCPLTLIQGFAFFLALTETKQI